MCTEMYPNAAVAVSLQAIEGNSLAEVTGTVVGA